MIDTMLPLDTVLLIDSVRVIDSTLTEPTSEVRA